LPDDPSDAALGEVVAGKAATGQLAVGEVVAGKAAAAGAAAGEAAPGDCGSSPALIVSAATQRGKGGMKRKRSMRAVAPAASAETPRTTTFELLIVRQPASCGPRYRMSMRTKENV